MLLSDQLSIQTWTGLYTWELNKSKSNLDLPSDQKSQKQKFSTTTINDCQLWRQKIRQKISVIKTNSFDWELFTFDDIKK